jgi:cellulose synthase/poly-beta-1,6-N-acetylglucosamine synthase-like glycosyltransferase
MELLLTIIAISTFIYLSFTAIEFYLGFSQLKDLSKQTVLDTSRFPSISIIVSALNEESEIKHALTSMLNLNYPKLEVIALNDRSSDKTPDILEDLKKSYSNLQVHHITHLPEAWFGKNHALHIGSQYANGEWLLFTDADVIMKPDTLIKAMSYVLEHKLDHLTICEHHLRRTYWLNILFLAHYLTYTMAFKPWRIRYPWSKKSLGHGAFNLINKKVYEKIGGHRAIAMECLDDLKLGALIKRKGYAQDTVNGRDYIEREWYNSLQNMIQGLKKNSFAFFDYQFVRVIGGTLLALTFFIWPWFACLFFSGYLRDLNIANICLTLWISAYVAKQFRLKKRYALFYPLSISILVYTIWNSAISTHMKKGVVWRGTHYPLKELQNKKA